MNTTPAPSALPTSSKVILKPSRTSTPVPPGLSLPQDFPPLAAPSTQPPAPPRLQRKATANTAIKPIVPNIASTAAKTIAATKEPHSIQQAITKTKPADLSNDSIELGGKKGKEDKEEARDTGPALQANTAPESSNVGRDITSSTSTKITGKQRPGKLDIAAAKDVSKNDIDSVGLPSDLKKAMSEVSGALSFLQPTTPASASSVLRQSLPRTLRLSRNENQPASPGNLPSVATSKQASRRPSMTSIHRPGSAAEERVSDNASFTSTSMSRANSPPPTKVGSAPVRAITKSQQRKDRQARARLAEGAAKVEEPAATIEEIQAPIVGRKKKAKKEKLHGTAESTPTITRPGSPVSKEEAMDETSGIPAAPATPVKDNRKGNAKAPTEIKEPDTPSSPATPATGDQQRDALTAASIFAHLQRAGDLSAPVADLFKSVPGINHRVESLKPISANNSDIDVPDDQMRQLEHGEAIRIEQGPNDYVVILPDRQTLPGLTADQASHYLDLRKRVLADGGIPPQQAIPASPAINAALAIASAKRVSKSKRLTNPFASPTATAGAGGPAAANMQKYAAAGTGTVDEGKQNKTPVKTVTEAEQAMGLSRRETEALEKKLNTLLKKNRRLLLGSSH